MTRNSGFTLLEVLVVVLIITILATIVGVKVANEPGRARVATARAQIGNFKTALNLYRMDNGRLPTQEQGLRALCRLPSIPPIPQRFRPGGYLDSARLPTDPWGFEYVYLVPGAEGQEFEILTYGADGDPGGEGEDVDTSSVDL
jgi:general secretion pathway protein G